MDRNQQCPAARIASGEHACELQLRPHDGLPGGLWSWSVYVDGDVHARAPGCTRRDPQPLYALLFQGRHRVVVRRPFSPGAPVVESNTLTFDVDAQDVIVIDVLWRDDRPHLALASEASAASG